MSAPRDYDGTRIWEGDRVALVMEADGAPTNRIGRVVDLPYQLDYDNTPGSDAPVVVEWEGGALRATTEEAGRLLVQP